MKKAPELTPLQRLRTVADRLVLAIAHLARRRGKVGVAAVGGLILAPLLVSSTRHHPYFALADVKIAGTGRVSRDEVLAWAGLRYGVSTWSLDLTEIRQRLEQQPWIEAAEVRSEMPNALAIRLNERKPMAIVRLDSLYYVDRRGHLLGPLKDGDSPDFPIITGLEAETVRTRMPGALPRAAQLLRWCLRQKCFDGISEVRIGDDNAMTIYPLEPKVAVIFGCGDWKPKLERLRRVWKQYQGRESRLASVDLSYDDSVVVSLKDEPQPAPTPKRKGTRI